LSESNPGDHPTNKPVALGHRTKHIYNPPVHQPKVTGIDRNLSVTQPIQKAIERCRTASLEPALAFTVCAHPVGNVGALYPRI
jgi:hypothetical protein